MYTIAEVIAGETLFLKILKPDGQWFDLQGVVAHHPPRLGFGVRFVNLDEKQHHQIRSLCRLQNACPPESADTSECRTTSIPLEQSGSDVSNHHVETQFAVGEVWTNLRCKTPAPPTS